MYNLVPHLGIIMLMPYHDRWMSKRMDEGYPTRIPRRIGAYTCLEWLCAAFLNKHAWDQAAPRNHFVSLTFPRAELLNVSRNSNPVLSSPPLKCVWFTLPLYPTIIIKCIPSCNVGLSDWCWH